MVKLRLNVDEGHYLMLINERRYHELFRCIEENRDFLAIWLPWVGEVTRPADTRRFLMNNLHSYRSGKGFSFAILEASHILGMIGFHGFDDQNKVTSLGYWLIEQATGHGLMTRCVLRCIDYAMMERNMNRLYIRCANRNNRSNAIPRRLGFYYEGFQREAELLNGQFVDLNVYSLLGREWRSRREALLTEFRVSPYH